MISGAGISRKYLITLILVGGKIKRVNIFHVDCNHDLLVVGIFLAGCQNGILSWRCYFLVSYCCFGSLENIVELNN